MFICSSVNADNTSDRINYFAYDSIVFAIDSMSNAEFDNFPEPTKYLIQNTPSLVIRILDCDPTLESSKLIIKCSALRLDGSLAEEHTCAILKRGRKILSYLKKYKATLKDMRQLCEKDARRLNVNPSSVCAEEYAVARRVDALIHALEKGRSCE